MLFRSREQTCELIDEDTLFFSWSGIVMPSDVAELFRQIGEQCVDPARVFFLWDMMAAQLLPRDTRRLLLEQMVGMPLEGTAVVTSDFQLRIPVTMLLEVVALDTPRRAPYRFFATKEEAIAWIGILRGEGTC